MKTIDEIMHTLLNECEIVYNNEFEGNYALSKEELMKTYAKYLLYKTSNNNGNNSVEFVLNTKSICYDVISMLYLIMESILNNDFDNESILRQLNKGDMVICNGIRQKFVEFTVLDNKFRDYIVLEHNGDKSMIPKTLWGKIKPYYGDANVGGKGVKKTNKDVNTFYSECLGMKKEEIPNEISVSSVIVAQKDGLVDIFKNTSIVFNGISIKLSDIATATYYASEDSFYQIGSNQTKSEPILKFTNKLSTARKLIKNKRGNKHFAVLIESLNACNYEMDILPEIITSRKIEKTIISLSIESDYSEILDVVGVENINKLYATTKDFIVSFPMNDSLNNVNSVKLSQKLDNIIDKEVSKKTYDNLDSIDFSNLKKNIKIIKSSELVSDEKDEFVIQSFSLWKLFENAPFNLQDMENMISSGQIRPQSPRERIARLKEIADGFPNSFLKEKANNIVDTLQTVYDGLYSNNPKANALLQKVLFTKDKKIAVIVDKAYYKTILELNSRYSRTPAYANGSLKFYTPSKFNNDRVFDEIITFGNYYDKNFNTFSCISSKSIVAHLYTCQVPVFEYYESLAQKREFWLNEMSTLDFDYEEYTEDEETVSVLGLQVEDENDLISEINALRFRSRSIYSYDQEYSGPLADTVKTVFFDSGEQAFFTKNYKPFCYDNFEKEIFDKDLDSLEVGDILIFTKDDSSAVDIVDGILQKIIELSESESSIVSNYEKSKHWKKVLQNYMLTYDKKPREFAKELKAAGVSVELITIIGWLDLNSQTVKPRDKENLEVIAKFTNDDKLLSNCDEYFDSGTIIYEARRKIKSEIKTAYAQIMKGQEIDPDSLLYDIKDQIKQMFDMYTVEHINDEVGQVPNNKANKPI